MPIAGYVTEELKNWRIHIYNTLYTITHGSIRHIVRTTSELHQDIIKTSSGQCTYSILHYILGARSMTNRTSLAPSRAAIRSARRRSLAVLVFGRGALYYYYYCYFCYYSLLPVPLLKQYSITQPEIVSKLVATFRSRTASFIYTVPKKSCTPNSRR